jgi:hypothetical protein
MQRELLEGVRFEDFAQLAKKKGWSVDDLAEEFRGKFGGKPGERSYEQPRSFFERIFAGKPSPDSVIVYHSVIEKYLKAVQYSALDGHVRRCECGCGSPVWGRKRTATDACRQRVHRAGRNHASPGLPKVA